MYTLELQELTTMQMKTIKTVKIWSKDYKDSLAE